MPLGLPRCAPPPYLPKRCALMTSVLALRRQPPSRFTPEEQPEPPPTPRKRARRPPPGAPSEAASSKRERDPLMKQYLSMLLFDRKNLRFSDFVRLQQLEVRVPLVAHDLAAREAAHGDDHGLRVAAVQDPGPPRTGGRALLTRRGPLSQRYVNRRASLERDGY